MAHRRADYRHCRLAVLLQRLSIPTEAISFVLSVGEVLLQDLKQKF